MYSAKYLCMGLLVGMVIGASNTMVQKYTKQACDCSKKAMDNMMKNENCMFETFKKQVNEKIDSLKTSFNKLADSLSKEELTSKLNEMKSKVETLFQEFNESFVI